MKATRTNFNLAVVDVVLRIVCFVIFYSFFIGVGILIFWGAFVLTNSVLRVLWQEGAFNLLIFIAIAGIWALAGMLGLYLIKPLFSFTRNRDPGRIEVQESECPPLFETIRELVRKTGCRMPRHVYLSTDANACVFYNTSFWNIFFPVRKNMEIGLGLFNVLSVDELKSIISHELGHFSQRSMKVGSGVYVTNTVLYNLIFTEDYWDGWLRNWCMSGHGLWRFFGNLTRLFTNGIKWVNRQLYRFVQPAYFKLSQYMEYDADRIACECAGTPVFISALCKLEFLARNHAIYEQVLQNMIAEKKILWNYFEGSRIVTQLLEAEEKADMSYKRQLSASPSRGRFKSRVDFNDTQSTHPALEKRIAAALENAAARSVCTPAPESAWKLVPKSVLDRISDGMIRAEIKSDKEIVILQREEFTAWVAETFRKNFIPAHLKPFFDRTILRFELPGEPDQTPVENPLSDWNAAVLEEYEVAYADWNTVCALQTGTIAAKDIRYDGKRYRRKKLPAEAHRQYTLALQKQAQEIDSRIFRYLMQKAAGDLKTSLVRCYEGLFYAETMVCDCITPLQAERMELLQELNKTKVRNQDEFRELVARIHKFEARLQEIIQKINFDFLSEEVDGEVIGALQKYVGKKHFGWTEIRAEPLNEMFGMTDTLGGIHDFLYRGFKKKISDTCQELTCAESGPSGDAGMRPVA